MVRQIKYNDFVCFSADRNTMTRPGEVTTGGYPKSLVEEVSCMCDVSPSDCDT